MTRDYNPINPIINPKLIKKINEVRESQDDKVFLDFLNVLYDSEFLVPVAGNIIAGSNTQFLDFVLLSCDDGFCIPIFTNYLEMKKMERKTKNAQSLVIDISCVLDLLYTLEESGVNKIIIDPFGTNLKLSLDFMQNADQIMQAQKQSKLIKEMHKELINQDPSDIMLLEEDK